MVTDLSIKTLKLDSENPRLAHLKEEKTTVKQEDMEKELQVEVTKLVSSIREAGGVYSPLIVQPERDDSYVVREGNIRLACLRELSKKISDGSLKDLPEDKFEFAPCIIFPKNISKEMINAYIASEHVAGKIKWDALDQALHVYDMFKRAGGEKEGVNKDLIIQFIKPIVRMAPQAISNMIDAVKLTHEYSLWAGYKTDPSRIRRYSYFLELVKLKNKRGLTNTQKKKMNYYTQEGKKEFFKWVVPQKGKKVGLMERAEHVRKIPQIIFDKKASNIFIKEGSTKAISYLEYEKGTKVIDAIDKLEKKLKESEMKKACKESPPLRDRLERLDRLIKRLLK
jgi:hypothetical protein